MSVCRQQNKYAYFPSFSAEDTAAAICIVCGDFFVSVTNIHTDGCIRVFAWLAITHSQKLLSEHIFSAFYEELEVT